MLKYENRVVIDTKVIETGKALNGKNCFRNKEAQEFFDKLRNRYGVCDYGRMDNKDGFYFQFLNGCVEYYTRKKILRLSKMTGEF